VTVDTVLIAVNLAAMMGQIGVFACGDPRGPVREGISAAFVVVGFWMGILLLAKVGP
jgi:hypothetical protein